MSKVVIFGSTGVTGLCTTEAAVQKGLHVRAFVRDPSKLPESLRSKVEAVQGDVLKYEDVLKAVQGTEKVIVVLGTRNDLKPTTDLSEGMKNIIKAMKESKVDVVSVCLSAFLFFDLSSGRIPPSLKDVTADHIRMYDALKGSALKYVAVFPPHIADQPGTGYQVEENKYAGRVVSKYDLGKFLVDAIENSEYYGKVIGIVSK